MASRDIALENQIFGQPNPCTVYPYPKPNTLKNYYVLEETLDPGSIQLRRSVDVKRIRLDNDTPYTLHIGVYPFRYTATMGCVNCKVQPQFTIHPSQSIYLGINMPGSNLQFFWVYDEEGNGINDPFPIDYHANTFVIKSGNYGKNQLPKSSVCSGFGCPSNKTTKWVWFQKYKTTL